MPFHISFLLLLTWAVLIQPSPPLPEEEELQPNYHGSFDSMANEQWEGGDQDGLDSFFGDMAFEET